ncbi:MaoC/PaaZ C-terminal domain-containing protein [Georgenia ruanii]|uniref:3-hydroxyacyl-thioester dehydratase n=1 Tax=Georgenia ruanii TaxID=348442 RepID=A0A7J9V0R7_9MICO|nr:MaoC/PaaZ C-terminal domain-containing protein [Georgenia ruanii]MPV90477.1 3-hydroxyacyl-thioester dehydratase [Georgenia ruanii]
MTLNAAALGATTEPIEISWTPKDCALYALGVGAGTSDLAFTTENTKDTPQRMLPTMPVTLGLDPRAYDPVGPIDWTRVVHAEQGFQLSGEVPVAGTAVASTQVVEMWDKEKASIVVTETTARDKDGDAELFRTRSAIFIRGAGGWGGERGPSVHAPELPEQPEHTVTYHTRDDQALIYRLSGDYNPLHSDPSFAKRAGFNRPILHGLCTYGFTGRALLDAAANGDPSRISSMTARFATPVYPGETLHIDLWDLSGELHFRTRREDGSLALTHGRVTITT